MTVFLTTQYLEEADRLADRIAVIDGGRVVAEGTPAELKQRSPSQRLDLVLADAAAFEAVARSLAGRAIAADAGRLDASASPTDGSAAHVRALLDEIDPGGDAVRALLRPQRHARRRLPRPHRPHRRATRRPPMPDAAAACAPDATVGGARMPPVGCAQHRRAA